MPSQINKLLNISLNDVLQVLKEEVNYICKSRKNYKQQLEDSEKIIYLYTKQNKTIETIAKELVYTPKTISKILRKNNIDTKSYNKLYSINDNAFDNYTPESVYWAGFIAGDGCIYSHGKSNNINNYINITVGIKDKEYLKRLKDFIEYNGKFYENNVRVGLVFNSEKIVNDLFDKYNITNKKSLTYIPPNNIPDNLVKYFILGIFDADGCINKTTTKRSKRFIYQMNFTGTKETCEYIKQFFESNVKLAKRRKTNTNNFTIWFQGNLQVEKYLKQLYDETSMEFCLKRKYQLYCDLCSQNKKIVALHSDVY